VYSEEIHDASKTGDLNTVKLLLSADHDLIDSSNDDGMTVLHVAAYNNQPNIVEYLIAEGADINPRSGSGSTPLHGAAYYGFIDIARILIENGCDPNLKNNGGYTPVLSALAGNQADMVELLITKGIDPNQRNNHSRTLLHQAVISGSSEMVTTLIRNGANLDARTNSDESPLWWAIRLGNNEIAKLLINEGSPIDSRMRDGTTLLHHATNCNNVELLELFIKNGLDINSTQRYGLTPLHLASIFGYKKIIDVLQKNNANQNIRSNDGGLPLSYALESGHEDLAIHFQTNNSNPPRNLPEIRGKYLGQPEPGNEPLRFDPDVILNPCRPHGGLTVSPDGKEIFWTRNSFASDMYEKIWYTKEINGKWTSPMIAPFSDEYRNSHPCFTPDGNRLYYNSNRPYNPGDKPEQDEDIWYVERNDSGWSDPINPGAPLNSEDDDFLPTVSANGNVYFIRISYEESKGRVIDIYKSSIVEGQFTDPQNLGEPLNSPFVEARPLIAPDESYIVFTSSRPGGLQEDLESYISFNNMDGTWSEPVPIGIEKTMQGISSDGKFWFYTDSENGMIDHFWVSSGVIENFKQ